MGCRLCRGAGFFPARSAPSADGSALPPARCWNSCSSARPSRLPSTVCYGYAQRRSDEDTAVSKYTRGWPPERNQSHGRGGCRRLVRRPSCSPVPDEKLDQFYQELPELTVYRTYLDNLRRKRAHILSDAEEKLLASSGRDRPVAGYDLLHVRRCRPQVPAGSGQYAGNEQRADPRQLYPAHAQHRPRAA